jgi:hypothetical protein
MAGSGKKRLPYQVTLSGFVALSTGFIISLCLFWYGAEVLKLRMRVLAVGPPEPIAISCFWAVLDGASFMGAALGAAIGQVFRDERGGVASMGAFNWCASGNSSTVIVRFMVFSLPGQRGKMV